MKNLPRRMALTLAFLLTGVVACQEAGSGSAAGGSGAGAEGTARTAAPRSQTQAQSPRDTIDLRTLGYDQGSAAAPVTVIEFSDFGCPYCRSFALETYPVLHRDLVETGMVQWKYVPFVMGMFPNGGEAARAAVCAGEQEEFWPMHDLLYERQREWKATTQPGELFLGYARSLGLEAEQFRTCYTQDRQGERTRAANLVADRVGIRATPTFIINGRILEGTLQAERFRRLLQDVARAAQRE